MCSMLPQLTIYQYIIMPSIFFFFFEIHHWSIIIIVQNIFEYSISFFFFFLIIGLTTIRNFSNTNQTGFSNLSNTNDILLTSIKTAKETKDILEMLRLHNSAMTIQQHLQALNSLFLLQKSGER